MSWSKQNANPKDPDSRDDSVAEVDYDITEDDGLALVGWFNFTALTGFNASPNVVGQSFVATTRNDPRVWHKASLNLSKRGLPQGYCQAAIYTVGAGVVGVNATPNVPGGKLILSTTVDANDIDGNGIYAYHDFDFEDDVIITPGASYVFLFRFIGANLTGNYIRVPVATINPGVDGIPGNYISGSIGNTNYLDPDWDGISFVGNGTASLDLGLRLYSRPNPATVFIPETTWGEQSNPSTVWAEGPTLPNTTWVEYDSYDWHWGRGQVRVLEGFKLVKQSRDKAIAIRDFVHVAETHDRNTVYVASEGIQSLDSATTEKRARSQSYAAAEGIQALDSAEVDIDSRNVTFAGRDYIALTESVVWNPTVVLSEGIKALDSAVVTKDARTFAINAGDFVRIAGELIGVSIKTTINLNKDLLALDTATVTKNTRGSSFVGIEYVAMGETVTLTTPIAEIANAEIDPELDVDTDLNRARCRFDTGVHAESCRVEIQVDGGGWTTHQDFNDTTPNTTGYVTNWYSGSAGELVQFRIRPFTANNLTGTEGNTFNTNIVSI